MNTAIATIVDSENFNRSHVVLFLNWVTITWFPDKLAEANFQDS